MKKKIHASMPEEESEPMKGPKKKKDEFKFKHPWLACSRQYGVLALVFLLGHIFFGILSDMTNVDYFRYPLSETFRNPFNLTANLMINRTPNMQGTEIYAAEMYADNARSILCTLVGSEAAIVAIVVSLTLIAIEFTASEYSPRVIDISLKNPDMWILLSIYGVAIFSSIILLKQLPYESRFPTEDVSFAFWLGVFSYVALVPYLRNTIRLFDPTNIVRLVAADIEKDKLLKYIKDLNETSKKDETKTSEDFHPPTKDSAKETPRTKGDTEGHEENLIQPILDIVYRSINKYDLETVRNGLKQIEKLAETVIDAYSRDNAPEKDNEKLLNSKEKQMSFSNHFCDPLRRISRLAASKDDEGSTIEVIKTLQTFGEKTADKQLNTTTEQVAVALGAVGKISVEKGKAFEEAVNQVASSLGAVGKAAADKGEEFEEAAKQAASSLKDVGKDAADNRLEEATKRVASSLGAVGETAADKGLEKATIVVASSFGTVGKAAADNGLEEATIKVASSLGAIGETAAGKGLEEVTIEVAKSLGALEKAAADNGLEKATIEVAKSLGALGKAAAGKGLDAVTIQAAKALEAIGKTAANKGLDKVTKEVAPSLGAIGETAANKGLEEVTIQAAKALEVIGETGANKGFDKVTIQAAKSLEALGETAAGNGLDAVTKEVASSLGALGETAAGKGLKDATGGAISSLEVVGTTAAENKLKDATKDVASSLGVVGKAAVAAVKKGKQLGEAVGQALSSLENLGEAATWETILALRNVGEAAVEEGKELEVQIKQAARSLGNIGKATAKKGKEHEVEIVQAAQSLEHIGKAAAADKELKDVVTRVAWSLLEVGTTVVEMKELKDATEQAAHSLAVLTILSKKIVETAISDYETTLNGSDSASFQKFKELYGLESGKMKAKAP